MLSSRSATEPIQTARRNANPSDSKEDRWRSFPIEEIKRQEYKIDGLKWLKDDSLDNGDGLLEPEELAQEAIGELEAALGGLREVLAKLEGEVEV